MCRACRFSLLVYLSLSPLGILSSSLKKFYPTPAQKRAFRRNTWRFLCQLDWRANCRMRNRAIQLSADFLPDWGETNVQLACISDWFQYVRAVPRSFAPEGFQYLFK